jgi:chromosome segregation ATPase
MNVSLTSLEAQLDMLLERYRSLRGENETLRSKVSELEACKRALQTKIDITAARLETLKSSLPVE